MKNYIKEYFSCEEHDLTSLINKSSNTDDKIKLIKNEIMKLQKELEEKSQNLNSEIEKAYTNNFTPTSKRIILRYNGRYASAEFDLNCGLAIDTTQENDIVYSVDNKSGEVSVVVGYSYKLASIICKTYKYSINKDNTKLTTKSLRETIISFMEDKAVEYDFETQETKEVNTCYSILRPLNYTKAEEFINTLYGTEYQGSLSLGELRNCNLNNKSFEIIIKTAPKEIVDNLLKLGNQVTQALPIHKIIGVSQEIYDKAVERGIVKILFENRDFISGKYNEKYNLHKTESEWLEFIDEMKHYEEDLDFYHIRYNRGYGGNDLLGIMLYNYTASEVFKNYYSFGKFTNYVINETINQGYNNIVDFIYELRDYLSMCIADNIKPTLYSSYLKQTHDITSRNHKVVVEKENEETFKNRYKDFKEYKGKNYYVVAPKSSDDLKKEGDRLNHCVASYIKRVIDGECLIYFLRKDKEESLITFEVRHNTIVQVKGLHNRKPTENEINALKEFAENRKMEVNF